MGSTATIATTVHELLVTDLRAAGVETVDARRALIAAEMPFFQTDPP